MLRVDSPGGSGTASDVIWREVALARKAKPVVVSMGDVAASGGYYIAMGSDAIVAQPGTITGSIGVFGGKFSLRGLYDKIGMSKEILTRGQHADLFSEYRPWNDEERAKYPRADGRVLRGVRHARRPRAGRRPYEDIDAVAQGRVWTGAEALAHGLVDRLGGLDVALRAGQGAGAASRKDQEVHLVVLPERKGLLETILERQEEGVEDARAARATCGPLLRWWRALRDGEPLARLPFELRDPLGSAASCRAAGEALPPGLLRSPRSVCAVDLAEGLVHAARLAHRLAAGRSCRPGRAARSGTRRTRARCR